VQGCKDGEPDAMQELLEAVFCRAESMPEGEVDDFQSENADMDHIVIEDLVGGDAVEREDNIYASFLNDADTSLFPRCKYSRLSFLVNLYHLKCLNGWTQESFTTLLGLLSRTLPDEANLPKTYYEAEKIIRGLGLDYVKIHACTNDCILFRGDFAEKDVCPICESSRWKDVKKKSSSSKSQGKKIPAKVLRYFPLIPRIQRLFSTNKTSDDM
jgi:hypothetical protein